MKYLPLLAALTLFANGLAANPVSLPPISNRALTAEHIIPADVLARATLVNAELELVGQELGKPALVASLPTVTDVDPRHVIFQAVTLHKRTSLLSLELTGTQPPEIDIPAGTIKPFHVWHAVNQSFETLRTIKSQLHIPEVPTETLANENAKPSDVYIAIAQANNTVNQLLATPVASSDVYQQITKAIHYSANLLGRYEAEIRIPPAPDLVRKKQPIDVYYKLEECYEHIQNIARAANLRILKVNSNVQPGHITSPADVYDFTSLILAELDYVHKRVPDAPTVRKSYYPGYKTPSQAYQRASILKAQLELLESYVTSDARKLVSD